MMSVISNSALSNTLWTYLESTLGSTLFITNKKKINLPIIFYKIALYNMDKQLHHTPNVQVIKKYNQQLFINLIFIPYI